MPSKNRGRHVTGLAGATAKTTSLDARILARVDAFALKGAPSGGTIVLSGPPGTERAGLAERLAAGAGRALMRVDLGRAASKYIGETEKNIDAAFEAAAAQNAVLFFDEADALFGKRTEVKDSHDRYANQEVNYLLQRIEAADGLVILATNRKSALDPTFLRSARAVFDHG